MHGDQAIQEKQYSIPYHWILNENEFRGRKYFGYLSLAIEKAKKHGLQDAARVLDAGCGDGRFIACLNEVGYEVEGMDYSQQAVAFARLLLPINTIHVADLTETPNPELHGKYDAVFLIETLEHIHPDNVAIILKNLKKMIKPGGILIITVPSTNLKLHQKHYQHFTAESLREYTQKEFHVAETLGYASVKHPFLRAIYKLTDNRYWVIKPLSHWYNKNIWKKHLNSCSESHGEGLLTVLKKKI